MSEVPLWAICFESRRHVHISIKGNISIKVKMLIKVYISFKFNISIKLNISASKPSADRYRGSSNFRRAYRGTSLTRKRTPLGPYHRPMPGVLWGS